MTTLPLSRVPDPCDAPALRWGILAPGGIASAFASALAAHTTQRIVAVGSRSAARAQTFAREHGIGVAHASYEALLDDPNVEAVYVASPHSRHAEQALAAISAGKHVLVEKSFTQDARQAAAVIDAARAAGITLMEAMWTRFLPHVDVLRQLLADGALGEIETVSADHGQRFTPDPAHRLFDPAAAGGALLDLGVYPVSFASMVLGTPGRITARGTLTDTGVDRQISAVFDQFPGSTAHALVTTTLAAQTPTRAAISGPEAHVDLPSRFYTPVPLRFVPRTGEPVTSPAPVITGSGGLAYEAAHFARLVAEGRVESPALPWAETLAIMQTMDQMRAQVGARFPGED
ncbi:MAG TPA: Gfo/Idh/MocA family oxidoreductase [Propioniciclava sp.]|jgi:predicted dehydrogenase|uniref:Gfo/Idh/MocA family protein n=1 Tax=Propioniciclava sp. TaxID=2038686 RepID=UPI002B938034|nr:Gfo/Idh/MocA family oxidoreductase [Propioniciclava sp.]HRL49277.1 Gfo/Idh/MocA family oxidoreductase [Propioniciclava sp.]